MKSIKLCFLAAVALLFCWRTCAQIYDTNGEYVQTFAGSGEVGYLDGQGQLTKFSDPFQIVADTSSNLYVLDDGNYLIRKITPSGMVSTFVGGGTATTGYGTNVSLNGYFLGSMVIDHSNTIWLLVANGDGYSDEGYLNISTNGYVSSQQYITNLDYQNGICFDSANNLYYPAENQIWRYNPSTGVSQPFAGNGTAGYVDGSGTVFPEFNDPTALACDEANNIYVWDFGNYRIRRIDQSQNITTIAGNGIPEFGNLDGVGTNTSFLNVSSMFADNAGNIYFACGGSIRKMNAQTNVVTMAGSFTQGGYMNGAGDLALFEGASGACMSGGTFYVADSENERIRDITFNPQPQVVSGANLGIASYAGVTITGAVGRTYEIQSSPDMNTWTTVATVLLTSSPYLWIDKNPISGNKFYQAVLLP